MEKIDEVEKSFQGWIHRNGHNVPDLHVNLFRGAHSAGYWDSFNYYGKELEALIHDVDRLQAANTELVAENERLREDMDEARTFACMKGFEDGKAHGKSELIRQAIRTDELQEENETMRLALSTIVNCQGTDKETLKQLAEDCFVRLDELDARR